jgi:hypothetical protein
MASQVPPINAEQLKTLLAQYEKRLRVRLTIWGAATAASVVVAVGVFLIAPGGQRAQTAASGAISMPGIPVATAVPLPPAELRAFKQASEAFKQTTAKLANVENNTAATRAETKRLAEQVNRLSVDNSRFTGRLANIEQQIDGITGSVRKEAQKVAAEAVAKAIPTKPAYSAFDSPAPIISPPATTPPKLSLLMPVRRPGTPDALTTSAITKRGDEAKPDTTSGSEAMADAELKTAHKTPDHKMSERASQTGELKASVGIQPKMGAIERRRHLVLPPAAEAERIADRAMANKRLAEKSMAKGEAAAKTAKPLRKIASVAPSSRHVTSPVRTRYGVDLGGADSVTIAKAQWAAVKANFGPILGHMSPIAVRNHRILVTGTFRLVAGHLRSWAAAKRVCELLARQHFACEPVKFVGQKVIWE